MRVGSDEEKYIDSRSELFLSGVAIRLMGPRRISAKANIEGEVYISERAEEYIDGDLGESGLEMKRKSVDVAAFRTVRCEERELAEELAMLEGAIQDEVEVIVSDAEARDMTLSGAEGSYTFKCVLHLEALVKMQDLPPRLYTKDIPVSEEMSLECGLYDYEMTPFVDILSENVSLNPSDEGVSVVFSVIMQGGASMIGSERIELLDDAYSTSHGVRLDESEYGYTSHLATAVINEKYQHGFKNTDVGAENVRNVLYECARVKLREASRGEGGVVLAGSIYASGIACEIDENGDMTYSPIKIEAPFEINVNYNLQIPANCSIMPSVCAKSVRIYIDGENVIVEGDLVGYCSLYTQLREPCITAVHPTDEIYAPVGNIVSAYFPDPGESLYDVAKRFHVSPSKLAADNELAESVISSGADAALCGVDYLLLFR